MLRAKQMIIIVWKCKLILKLLNLVIWSFPSWCYWFSDFSLSDAGSYWKRRFKNTLTVFKWTLVRHFKACCNQSRSSKLMLWGAFGNYYFFFGRHLCVEKQDQRLLYPMAETIILQRNIYSCSAKSTAFALIESLWNENALVDYSSLP